MRSRMPSFVVPAVMVAMAAAASTQAETQQIPVVRLHQQAEIAAPAPVIWAYLTQGKNLVTWCPRWKAPGNTKMTLTKVGDVLDFTDEWGGNGRSVVTYLVKDKELRVVHEPNQGDYVCQAKLALGPSAKGTVVHYWEQYTDESGPKDLEATAQKVDAEMRKTLATLKAALEKH